MILNRYSILYGEEYPIIAELERAYNSVDKTTQFTSLFKVALEIANNPEMSFLNDAIRDFLGEKTGLHDLVNIVTENKYHIPTGLSNLLKRHSALELEDAFSIGQLKSKLWIAECINDFNIDLGDQVYICAGWYGVLSAILFEQTDFTGKILSFDIDPDAMNVADTLNKPYVSNGSRFKAVTKDIQDLFYEDDFHTVEYYQYHDTHNYSVEMDEIHTESVDCVINTSCEHIENFDEWWANVPEGMLVILQNNDFVEHDDETVVNTVKSEQRWVDKVPMTNLMYRGTLKLDKYKRFMVIGRK